MHSYLIALGSNMRVPGVGLPRKVLEHAIAALDDAGLDVRAVSPVIDSAPVGPSQRRYANAATVIETRHLPDDLLRLLQGLEHDFGRDRRGQRWRPRPLDIDIILWSGGIWASDALQIPHPRFRERAFVLGPASSIAPIWRDPLSGNSVTQLQRRLTRGRPLPR